MKDELSDYIFHKEAKDILEKCREISNPIEIKREEKENTSDNKDNKNPKEEKEKLEEEAKYYLRGKISNLIDYVEDDILLFEEESLNGMNEEDFKESLYYVEQKLKELTKALILGKKEDRYYDSNFENFCECLYDRCKLEYARYCNCSIWHCYRIYDTLLMVSNTVRKKIN